MTSGNSKPVNLRRSTAGLAVVLVALLAALIAVTVPSDRGDTSTVGRKKHDLQTQRKATIDADALVRESLKSLREWKGRIDRKAKRLRGSTTSRETARKRHRSRSRYSGLNRRDAKVAVREKLPQLAETPAWRGPELKKGEKIVSYESATQARIARNSDFDDETPESLLVVSGGSPIAVPDPNARGRFSAISTELVEAPNGSGWVPERTAVSTRFPETAADAIDVGSPQLFDGVRVKFANFQDRNRAPVGELIGASKLFYANTAKDTDAILEPTAIGASVSWALRSPHAPERHTLGLELPKGNQVRLDKTGDVEIVTESDVVIGRISAPSAFDATNASVPAKFELTGNTLTVVVPHANRTVTYPIGVDPVTEWYGNPTVRPHNIASNPYGEYWLTAAHYLWQPNYPRVWGGTTSYDGFPQLVLQTGSGSSGGVAGWTYYPVRDATVVRADYAAVRKLHSGIALGIGMLDSSGGWQAGQWAGWYVNGQYQGGAGSPFGNPAGYTMTTPGTSVLACAQGGSACTWGAPTNNAAMFSISATSGTPVGDRADFLGAYYYLSDNENPTISGITGTPSGAWQQASSVTIGATSSDNGLGVGKSQWGAALELGIDGEYHPANRAGPDCSGDPGNECLQTHSADVTAQVTGERQLSVRARDIVGKSSTVHTYPLRNDGEAPRIALSGRFGAFALDASQQTAAPRTMVTDTPFVATITDGSTSSNAQRQSGVRDATARLYGANPAGAIDTSNLLSTIGSGSNVGVSGCDAVANPANNSCSLKFSGSFDAATLPPGIYFVRVDATDFTNRTSQKDFKVAVGIAELSSVVEGQSTARYLPIEIKQKRLPDGSAIPNGHASSARVQWRATKNEDWSNLPLDAVKEESTGSQLGSWPVTLTDGLSQRYVLDLDKLRTGVGGDQPVPDGEVSFRALVEGTQPAETRGSEDVAIRFDRGGRDTEDDRTELGPGSVDLVTGNFSMSDTDVSVDAYKSSLTVSRTYNSRYSAMDKPGVFGPGWTADSPTEESGSEYTSLKDNADVNLPEEERYPFVEISGSGGSVYSFELQESTGEYYSEIGFEHLQLKRIGEPAIPTNTVRFELTDTELSTITKFERPDPAAEVATFVPTEVEEIGEPGSTKLRYFLSGGKSYVSAVVAASGPVGCTGDVTAMPKGCQALVYGYIDVSVQGVPAGKRLQSVSLYTYAPELASQSVAGCNSSTNMCLIEVSRYSYDGSGRLSEAWDPRTAPALKTTYGYHLGTAQALIQTVTPPGEAEHTLGYESLPEDNNSGRVAVASRSHSSQSFPTWTVRYYVPTGSSGPIDMSHGQVSQWGQDIAPYMATAVFTPDQGFIPLSPTSEQYQRASISYLDPLGREVNSHSPGGRISATEFNKYGEQIRSLSAENRARAMAEPTPSARLSAAERWDNEFTYENVVGSLEGKRHLVRSVGPERSVQLDNGTTTLARTITQTCYDEGSPLVGESAPCKNEAGQIGSEGSARTTDTPTEEPLDLPTTTRTSALVGSVPATTGSADAKGRATGGTIEDTRKNTASYGTTLSEWRMRAQRLSVTDPDGLNIARKTDLNADGRETARYQPMSVGLEDPRTTKTIYYTSDPGDGACGGKPEWLGLPCKVLAGAQPSTSGLAKLPEKTITYNWLRQPMSTTETVDDAAGQAKSRTTTTTYDLSGRSVTESVTGNVGSSIRTTKHIFDPNTGRETQTQSLNTSGTVYKTVSRSFDNLGRQTAYTDAEGHTSTTTYDVLSRVASTNDGKAIRTNTYDPVTGDLVGVTDSGMGDFAATYDADGRVLTTVLPGGMLKTYHHTESGFTDYVSYSKTTGCSASCTVFENSAKESAHGQIRELWQDMIPQGQSLKQTSYEYHYDKAGRLKEVGDWRNDSGTWKCQVRQYTLDKDSNRTKKESIPENDNFCDFAGSGTEINSSYDNADRLTSANLNYDAFGRVLTTPAASAGGTGNFSATYFVNDLARSVTQNGTVQMLALDPKMRMMTKTKATGGNSTTESYAYTDDSDSPAWIQTGSTWQRYVDGIDGAAGVQNSSGSTEYYFVNLRGDVVAQGFPDPVEGGEVDEFGVPKTDLPADRRYGFHGSKQREALTSQGMVAMGVRLYAPRTGRFLQVDPVLGGTANPYEYPSDPVNMTDLDGKRYGYRPCGAWLHRACEAASRAIRKVARFVYRNVCVHYGAVTHTAEKWIKRGGRWFRRVVRWSVFGCIAYEYRRILLR